VEPVPDPLLAVTVKLTVVALPLLTVHVAPPDVPHEPPVHT